MYVITISTIYNRNGKIYYFANNNLKTLAKEYVSELSLSLILLHQRYQSTIDVAANVAVNMVQLVQHRTVHLIVLSSYPAIETYTKA